MYFYKYVKSPGVVLYLQDFNFKNKEFIFSNVYSKKLFFIVDRDLALQLLNHFISINEEFKNLEICKEY